MEGIIAAGVIAAILYLIIAIASAFKFEEIAELKGYSGYFLWVLFCGIVGMLMVVALPDITSEDIGSATSSSKPDSAQNPSARTHSETNETLDSGTCHCCHTKGVWVADTEYGRMCIHCYKLMREEQ